MSGMQRAKDALRCPVVLVCGQQESVKEEEEEERIDPRTVTLCL